MDSCEKNMLRISSTYVFLMMFLLLQLQVASLTDTILANQSLSGYQTLVSSGGAFELGFFTQGTSNLFYLGIWYRQISRRTVVWVANRENPAEYVNTIDLYISTGSLNLYDNSTNSTIWRGGDPDYRVLDFPGDTDAQAVLLDNGNLVLRDGNKSVLWQSFDNPSDTWLPGAKIRLDKTRRSNILTSAKTLDDPSPGLYSLDSDPNERESLVLVWNGSKPYFDFEIFDKDFKVFDLSFRFNLSFENGSYYMTYSVRNQNTFRIVMAVSGELTSRRLGDNSGSGWNLFSFPSDDRCVIYGSCGSFGICNNSSYSCECINIPGHSFPNASSGSCVSQNYLNSCGKRSDKFLPLLNMRLPTDPDEKVSTKSTSSCDSACLADCSCRAYAYDGNMCLIWKLHVFNLQQLDANNSEGKTFYVRLIPHHLSERTNHRKVITIVLAVLLPSIAATALFIIWYRDFSSSPGAKRAKQDKKQRKEIFEGGIIDAEDDDGKQKLYLNLHDIMAATNSFSQENKLGEGGFGPVYKGNLPNGIEVAIKRLSKKSSQGLTEFRNEVVLIIKLQHKNLVRLLGYCVEGDEKLLIYEYMSNKSLDALLFDSLKCKELDWEKRMNIVIGTTKGLQYLHEDSRLKIIHRDLKASNILLDDEMNPKISDFGTARIFGCNQIDEALKELSGHSAICHRNMRYAE